MTSTRFAALLAVPVLLASACSDFATEPDRYPAELRVTPDTVLVTEGDPLPLEIELLDQDGVPFEVLPTWAVPAWSADDDALVRFGADGRGEALAPGQSQVTAELAGFASEVVVRANPTELTLDVPVAYIVQVSQDQSGSVPLVAGREGLLRVFVTGSVTNFFRPGVTATFTRDGGVVHTAALELSGPGLPRLPFEARRDLTYEAQIPASVIGPGLGMSIEVDAGGLPLTAASVTRFPASGELALDVREVPPFRLRMVPVNHSLRSLMTTSSVNNVIQLTRDIFPFSEFDVDVRASYTTTADVSGNDFEEWVQLILEIATLREDDGSDRYYYGGFQRAPLGVLGLGFIGGFADAEGNWSPPVSIGHEALPETIAHEIGHTLSLPHAPCGNPDGVDPLYPYTGAGIGRYGYDRSRDQVQRPDDRVDLMSYCSDVWISDYNYERVLAFRDTSIWDMAFEDPQGLSMAAPRGEALLVTGAVVDGELVLRPAVLGRGAGVAPTGEGEYTLEGLAEDGSVLFSYAVQPRPVAHFDAAAFVQPIPAQVAQTDRLATLRLRGPEGVVERSRTTAGTTPRPPAVVAERVGGLPGLRTVNPAGLELRWDPREYPLVVVRDRATGQIIGMAHDGSLPVPRSSAAEIDIQLSDGVSTRRARVEVR